ncbi:MAG: chromate resistance protein [Betaproteobacteria bacterium]|nr:chromate resistance protein [Betaproteobacteria bacterium]
MYVPTADVMNVAQQTGAIPYDVPGVEFGHHGDRCSFDAFLAKYRFTDPPLQKLARIVRGADTGKPELTPEAAGLLAISRGLSLNFEDDHEMLERGVIVYDALYAWCREQGRGKETANGKPR